MKTLRKTLSLTLVFALVFSLMSFAFAADTTTTTTTTGYTDAASITYKEAVDVATAIGVFQGNDSKAFAPKDNLTREQAAKVICYLTMGKAAADKLSASADPFTDVPAARWSAGSIAYCQQQGIVAGYGNGKFGPTDTVTGYQFDKMLLVALGYDAAIEKLNGSDWSINVAKLAFANGLSAGNSAFVGNTAATREEAALYAKNLLTAKLVTYDTKGTNIKTSDGTVINVGASAPKQANDRLFMGAYFSGLRVNNVNTRNTDGSLNGAFDDAGNAVSRWTLNGKLIGEYGIGATVVYTAETTSSAVAKDLKGYTFSVTKGNNWSNGVAEGTDGANPVAASVNSAATIAALTADGRTVSVYTNNNTVIRVTVVDKVLAKVTYINTKAETVTVATVTGGGYANGTASLTTDLGYGKVAVGDYVIVSTVNAGAANIVGDTQVTSLVPATVVTGKATSKSNSDGTITINSKAYTQSVSVATGADVNAFVISAKNDATLVLDDNGYIMLAKSGTALNSDNIFVLTDAYQTIVDNKIVYMVKGYNSTGALVDLPTSSTTLTTATNKGQVFTLAETSGVYALTAITAWLPATATAPDNATTVADTNIAAKYAFNVASTSLAATAKTVSVNYNTSSTATYYFAPSVKTIFATSASVTVVNGVQTIPANTDVTYILGYVGNTYQVVAIVAKCAPSSTANTAADLVFLAKIDAKAVIGNDGKVYDSYTAVQNGVPVANCYGSGMTAATDVGKFYTMSKNETTGVSTLTAYGNAGSLYTQSITPVTATSPDGSVVTAGTMLDVSKATIINLDTKSTMTAAEIAYALQAKQQGASTTAPWIAAVYSNTNNVASIVYYTAKSMASVTVGTGTVNGLPYTITADKTHVAPGDSVTYTLTYSGTATAPGKITITGAATVTTAGHTDSAAMSASDVIPATTVTLTVTATTAAAGVTAIPVPAVTFA